MLGLNYFKVNAQNKPQFNIIIVLGRLFFVMTCTYRNDKYKYFN